MKAPVVIAKVRGYHLFDETAIRGYASLEPGDGILLVREPDNPADKNAIICEVDCEQHGSHPVGYIDRDSAATLSKWLDKGWVYTSYVIRGPQLDTVGFFIRLSPTPEAKVKCVPIKLISVKRERKVHAPI